MWNIYSTDLPHYGIFRFLNQSACTGITESGAELPCRSVCLSFELYVNCVSHYLLAWIMNFRFPFFHQGSEYHHCVFLDGKQFWKKFCPVGDLGGSKVRWEFNILKFLLRSLTPVSVNLKEKNKHFICAAKKQFYVGPGKYFDSPSIVLGPLHIFVSSSV